MADHPLYAMWKERQAAELAGEEERRRRAAARQQAQAEWRGALDSYQRHWVDGRTSAPRRPWWRCLRSLGR